MNYHYYYHPQVLGAARLTAANMVFIFSFFTFLALSSSTVGLKLSLRKRVIFFSSLSFFSSAGLVPIFFFFKGKTKKGTENKGTPLDYTPLVAAIVVKMIMKFDTCF